MTRMAYKAFRLASGSQYWTRRRFTPAGRFVLGCLTLTAVLGLDTDLTLAYQVFTFCLALLGVAYLSSLFYRGRFEVERRLPPFVTAGEAFSYKVKLRNGGSRNEHDLDVIERMVDPRPTLARFRAGAPQWWRGQHPHWRALIAQRLNADIEPASVARLGPGEGRELNMEGRAHHRGTIRFEALTLGRRDPLGLCRALIDLPRPQTLVVLPHRYQLPEIALPGRRIYQHGGVTLAASKGDSEEFVGLRDYRPGDPLKRVHWKSFARTGRPVVKEYQDEYFERHALVLDTFVAGDGDPAFEEAVSMAASFVCTMETQENLLDLMFIGDQTYTFTAGLGQLHTDGMLAVLAGVQACPDGQLEDLRQAVLEKRATLSGCILLLASWNAERRRLVEELTHTGLPLKVFLITATNSDPPGDLPAGVLALEAGRIPEGLATA